MRMTFRALWMATIVIVTMTDALLESHEAEQH
jgi:hypothetical protein